MAYYLFGLDLTGRFISKFDSRTKLSAAGVATVNQGGQIQRWKLRDDVKVDLGSKGIGEETIEVTVTDWMNRVAVKKVPIIWIQEDPTIKLSKFHHEVFKVGVHDIDSLIDVSGPVRKAAITGNDTTGVRLLPRITEVKSFESEKLNKTYSFIASDNTFVYAGSN